jgi:hypothetical protein
MLRSKTLRPERLPFGVIAIDGKTSWVGAHAGDVEAQHQDACWNLRWMRAVLTSARSRPCIDQEVIPAKTNEMGHFPAFWKELTRAYQPHGPVPRWSRWTRATAPSRPRSSSTRTASATCCASRASSRRCWPR